MIKLPIACSILLALTVVKSRSIDDQWTSWKVKHNKQYDIVEDQNEETKRRQIWQSRLDAVNEHNARFEAGLESYRKGLNQFSDMTWDELESLHLQSQQMSEMVNTNEANKMKSSEKCRASVKDLPDSVDWRTKGYVTPVKDQGGCHAGWAYAAVGTLEGQLANKTGKTDSLSTQQLIDCCEQNYGCNGGGPYTGLYYTEKNGVTTDEKYGFKQWQGKCSYTSDEKAFQNSGVLSLRDASEERLTELVANRGPVAVRMQVPHDLYDYSTGIFTTDKCTKNRFNHAVLVIGYGSEGEEDYWLVKNSWGLHWGDEGYFKIARNKDDMCNLAVYPSVAIV